MIVCKLQSVRKRETVIRANFNLSFAWGDRAHHKETILAQCKAMTFLKENQSVLSKID